MRTTDFSHAPPQGRAGSFFLGCNLYHSPVGMIRQVIRWPRILKALNDSPGYLWHRSYYHFPFGIGLMVGFESTEDLKLFARTPEHHEIMHWLVDSGTVKGGFIRILTPHEHGYANGSCSPEGQTTLIDTFAPLEGEIEPVSTAGRDTGAHFFSSIRALLRRGRL
ncbi:MAG: hypothetical protein Q4G50_01890 [Corynebacterium sp.]|uniref:hypothetical protein n=1 Tax=Corynebacterium sp. TaxID=1720 RepID=UPI0026E0127A|nr:hypothetical protein [Corynebacterium sp.]MDO5668733.1 hypothetical protein [Corynebacterium sp.]